MDPGGLGENVLCLLFSAIWGQVQRSFEKVCPQSLFHVYNVFCTFEKKKKKWSCVYVRVWACIEYCNNMKSSSDWLWPKQWTACSVQWRWEAVMKVVYMSSKELEHSLGSALLWLSSADQLSLHEENKLVNIMCLNCCHSIVFISKCCFCFMQRYV